LKTTTRPLGNVHCPVEPEVLLALIQGDLLIDEAREVRLHIQTCERCSARFNQLQSAYEQVASLNDVPELPVADLRDNVLHDSQVHLRVIRMRNGLNLSVRATVLMGVAAIGIVLILIATLSRTLLQGNLLSTQRSQNLLTKVDSVGTGLYYAETIKLVPVKVSGADWDIGEVVTVDEHTGQVVRSLPASSSSPFIPSLGIGSGTNIKPVLSSDGKILIEAAVTSDGHSPSAFAIIDALTGKIRSITRLKLPTGADPQQADPTIRQFWLSSDGKTLFILSDLVVKGLRTPHVFTFTVADGKQSNDVMPPTDANTTNVAIIGTTTAISPDGASLYDVAPGTDDKGNLGIFISFGQTVTRTITSRLFIEGDFQLVSLVVAPDNKQIYVFNGATATLYTISATTRAVIGTLPLQISGGAANGTKIQYDSSDMTSIAVTSDNHFLAIGLDRNNQANRAYNFWIINIDQGVFQTYSQLTDPVGMVSMSSDNSSVILLRRDGTLGIISVVNSHSPKPWVSLAGNAAVIQSIGAVVPAATAK